MRRLDGLNATVMGLGRFGGGVGVTRYLADQGASVTVTDVTGADELHASIAQIQDLLDAGTVRLQLGHHDLSTLNACDLLVVNPAVPRPWDNPFIAAAIDRGIELITEIQLLLEQLQPAQVIGITGTAGKSTTAAMIHHILTACDTRAVLGGNIGGSLLGQVDPANVDVLVLELSSSMLHWVGAGREQTWSPAVAVVTNIRPNHTDWHGSFEHYARSKSMICAGHAHGGRGHLLVPGNAEGRAEIETWASPSTTCDIIDTSADTQTPISLPGAHNLANAHLAAAAVACMLDSPPTLHASLTMLQSFNGLPHRLEMICESNGRRFVNDSKSTTPRATELAVEAFDDPRHVHLIAGGYDKQIDLKPISQLAAHLGGLYTIGTTAAMIAGDASAPGRVHTCGNLARAVRAALDRMERGDILLLSPGCASWDQYDNYTSRGTQFRDLVTEMTASASARPTPSAE